LLGKSEGKIPRGRPRFRWENTNNVRMDLRGIGWEIVDRMHLDHKHFIVLCEEEKC
jgi:hypothetical protein